MIQRCDYCDERDTPLHCCEGKHAHDWLEAEYNVILDGEDETSINIDRDYPLTPLTIGIMVNTINTINND